METLSVPSILHSAYLFNLGLTVDAKIMFNNRLTVSWGGQPIGVMKMDPINVVSDIRA